MTLTTYDNLEQGSEEWLAARRGMVTASTVGNLITSRTLTATDYDCPSCAAVALLPCVSKRDSAPIKTMHSERTAVAQRERKTVLTPADTDDAHSLTWLLAAERITGWTEETRMTDAMWRGVDDEPRARDAYTANYAPVQTMGFMVEDRFGFPIGYSPDGLVGDDGLIEIKSRAPKTQVRTIVEGEIPAANMAQLQCGLLVSGRKWIDYVSYAGGMHLWPQRVLPDPAWFDVIVEAVAQFEERAAEIIGTYNENVQGLALTERVTELEIVI